MVADELIVKKIQDGDQQAYGKLVRRYQERVYNLALKMLSSPEDARDAAQEIFVRVFRSLSGFKYQASFSTWIFRIATNLCLDQLRQRRREPPQLSGEEFQKLGDKLSDGRPSPEEILLEQENLQALRQAVRDLPEAYRAALILHHYQGFSYRQVAQILDLSEKTVATHLHRAKKMLKTKLNGGEGGALPENKKNIKSKSGRRVPIL